MPYYLSPAPLPLHKGNSDTLIGETTIDLEDRWFHKKWQAIGATGEATEEQRKVTGAPKYIEARDLHHPTKSNSQGKLYLWVEIIAIADARAKPPVVFLAPEEIEIEVRVIVWAMRDFDTPETSQVPVVRDGVT